MILSKYHMQHIAKPEWFRNIYVDMLSFDIYMGTYMEIMVSFAHVKRS